MPYTLDEIDEAILKSLLEDGRKSFRKISRELQVSTPTIKARYERLINIGLIKSIAPIIDTAKLEENSRKKLDNHHTAQSHLKYNFSGMVVKMKCDYCEIPIAGDPHVLKFANYERFFCCSSCKTLYKEKYKGRIESLVEKNHEPQ